MNELTKDELEARDNFYSGCLIKGFTGDDIWEACCVYKNKRIKELKAELKFKNQLIAQLSRMAGEVTGD